MSRDGVVDPMMPVVPSSLGEELSEFYRLTCPSKRANASHIAQEYGRPGEAAELRRHLEEQYNVPHRFETLKFDFMSRFFDPLQALYNPHVVPPEPRAAPLDNVRRCMALLPAGQMEPEFRINLEKKLESVDSGVRDAMKQESGGTVEARAHEILQRVAQRFKVGPISLLRRCFESCARVRVVLRRQRGIHGVVQGTLLAFDNHWNMLLADVDEEVRFARPARKGERILSRGEAGQQQEATSEGKTQEKDPDELPAGWKEHISKTHGKVYYYNKYTKERQWTRPKPEQATPRESTSAAAAAKPSTKKALPQAPESMLDHPLDQPPLDASADLFVEESRRRHLPQLILRGENVLIASMAREFQGTSAQTVA